MTEKGITKKHTGVLHDDEGDLLVETIHDAEAHINTEIDTKKDISSLLLEDKGITPVIAQDSLENRRPFNTLTTQDELVALKQ